MRYIFIILVTLFSHLSFSQTVKLDNVKLVKHGKLIISHNRSEKFNKRFENIVKEFWTFTEIVDVLPEKEAKKKSKEPGFLYIQIEYLTTSSMKDQYGEKTYSYGYRLVVKQKGKRVLKHYVPYVSQGNISDAMIAYAVSTLQDVCETMLESNSNKNYGLNNEYNKRANLLDQYTIYVNKGDLSKKISDEDLKNCKFKIKVVDQETWSNAILNKQNKIAYVILLAIPQSGEFYGRSSLVLADTQQFVYAGLDIYFDKEFIEEINTLIK